MYLKFVKPITILFLALFAVASCTTEKPNFLFVMVDDMAPDAISASIF